MIQLGNNSQFQGTGDLSQLLRKGGYRATPPRLAVLEVLQKARRPLTIKEIMAGSLAGHMDQVTVYRTLKTLKKIGMARQIEFQHGHAHFEIASARDHHHIICTKCERIEDFTECFADEIKSKLLTRSSRFAEITDHSLEIFGICKACN